MLSLHQNLKSNRQKQKHKLNLIFNETKVKTFKYSNIHNHRINRNELTAKPVLTTALNNNLQLSILLLLLLLFGHIYTGCLQFSIFK